MRINMNRMIVALAAVVLVGTGAVFASPSPRSQGAPKEQLATYSSGRASILLAEIQKESTELRRQADTLGTFAGRYGHSWQSHVYYLTKIKGHINAVGERTAELQQIRHAVLPWQQQAITELTSHGAKVAASTQAAILYLNENQDRLFVSEYGDHLTTIADSSEDMKQTVDRFLDYEKTRGKLQQLQNELELGG